MHFYYLTDNPNFEEDLLHDDDGAMYGDAFQKNHQRFEFGAWTAFLLLSDCSSRCCNSSNLVSSSCTLARASSRYFSWERVVRSNCSACHIPLSAIKSLRQDKSWTNHVNRGTYESDRNHSRHDVGVPLSMSRFRRGSPLTVWTRRNVPSTNERPSTAHFSSPEAYLAALNPGLSKGQISGRPG
jgi:hypothetical protein